MRNIHAKTRPNAYDYVIEVPDTVWVVRYHTGKVLAIVTDEKSCEIYRAKHGKKNVTVEEVEIV